MVVFYKLTFFVITIILELKTLKGSLLNAPIVTFCIVILLIKTAFVFAAIKTGRLLSLVRGMM